MSSQNHTWVRTQRPLWNCPSPAAPTLGIVQDTWHKRWELAFYPNETSKNVSRHWCAPSYEYDNCCVNCFQLHFSLILILWRWAEWKTHLSWKDVAHGVAQVGVPVDPLLLRVADVVGHRLIPVPTAHHSLTPIFWWFRFNWEHIWSYQANFLSRNRSVKYICTPSSRKFVSSPVTQGVMPILTCFWIFGIFFVFLLNINLIVTGNIVEVRK